ncbi:alpha-tocopherol transfer protein [Halyomorpha halys]|uniref:alpha-tocopherol transfer protein n=1 Tax=Halyomorpha halys TaxID=286706 RepID=UPI0006D4F636|nr:alpha-tocopherol transfer protein-like [Halyomorpha halys]
MKKEVNHEDVGRLREWLLMQPHYPKFVDDEILAAFAHSSKSLEIAKHKLETFFTWRAHLRNSMAFFNIKDPSDSYFKECSKCGQLYFLPQTTPEGYRVLLNSITDQFQTYFDQDQTIAAFHMSLELSLARWPDMKGLFLVWDLKGFTASNAAKLSFPTLETTIRYFQDCYPAKIKGVVFINSPPVVEMIYNNGIKPFLKDKLKTRITITGKDSTCLKKYLPEEILPLDYGGKEKHSSELYADWMNLLEEKKDWLKRNLLLVADETKRPPNSKQMFGVEGTFRTLDID